MTGNKTTIKGQLLTPVCVLIMGLIMVPVSALQQPYIATAGVFGVICIALGVGGLYFYNKDKKAQDKLPPREKDPDEL